MGAFAGSMVANGRRVSSIWRAKNNQLSENHVGSTSSVFICRRFECSSQCGVGTDFILLSFLFIRVSLFPLLLHYWQYKKRICVSLQSNRIVLLAGENVLLSSSSFIFGLHLLFYRFGCCFHFLSSRSNRRLKRMKKKQY